MPGRTKCANCGRPFTSPDRNCGYCGAERVRPVVSVATDTTEFHTPPAKLFRRGMSMRAVAWMLLALLVVVGGWLLVTGPMKL